MPLAVTQAGSSRLSNPPVIVAGEPQLRRRRAGGHRAGASSLDTVTTMCSQLYSTAAQTSALGLGVSNSVQDASDCDSCMSESSQASSGYALLFGLGVAFSPEQQWLGLAAQQAPVSCGWNLHWWLCQRASCAGRRRRQALSGP